MDEKVAQFLDDWSVEVSPDETDMSQGVREETLGDSEGAMEGEEVIREGRVMP